MRLDKYLVENKYFDTRNKALNAIKNGAIKVDGKVIYKAALEIENQTIEIVEDLVLKYVSRGGLKLEAAITTFQLDFKDKVVLDIGSSTGGFTDCALQYGAKLVYAVDVGTNQLDLTLRNNSKVEVYENTNILSLVEFKEPIDIVLMDCSFISVNNILPALDYYLNENNYLILLIKPQFEVGKIKLKNGILKDSKKHLEVLENVEKYLNSRGMNIISIIKSPIKGGDGNQEYLAKVKKMEIKKYNFLSIIK